MTMSKKVKAVKAPLITAATDANAHALKQDAQPVVTEVVSTAAKLTKRNSTPISAVLALTDKVPKVRAGHNKDAWEALKAALPCTAAELAKVEALNAAPIVCSQFVSYMIRRGFLKPQA